MAEKWFGENWSDYVKNIDDSTIEEAKKSLLRYLPSEDWQNKVFVDIGCGSGIFSLAALKLGASLVISIDLDDKSINATNFVRSKYGKDYGDDSWEVRQGSILDEALVNEIQGVGDIVYAWGSLHHTGNMKLAIKNACRIVKPNDGFLILAIYNHAISSERWLGIKKTFAGLPNLLKTPVELAYASAVTLGYVAYRRTLNLKKDRGMDVFHDAIDWMRGYPYEYACVDEIEEFVEKEKFEIISTPTELPCERGKEANLLQVFRAKNVGCNEFVFGRD
ncbi:MAG: 50S ribosomal protein L11 methyltransferase [Candidatus Micrarchaeia archaeon]